MATPIPPIVWGLKADIDKLKKQVKALEDKLANNGSEREVT